MSRDEARRETLWVAVSIEKLCLLACFELTERFGSRTAFCGAVVAGIGVVVVEEEGS